MLYDGLDIANSRRSFSSLLQRDGDIMPSAAVMSVDNLGATIDAWTDNRDGAVFVVDEFSACYLTTEEAAAERAKAKGGECHNAGGVRSVLIERVERVQWQRCRVQEWMEIGFVIAQFEYVFVAGMAGVLTKAGLGDTVSVSFGACETNLMAHVIRESANIKWGGEITVEARQEDKLLESVSRETEFPVGKWEHFLFYVLPFSAKVGPCALRLVVEGHCIAQRDVEIVSENNAAVPLPRLPEGERLAM